MGCQIVVFSSTLKVTKVEPDHNWYFVIREKSLTFRDNYLKINEYGLQRDILRR